jgi:ABC-type transport system involved in multi-copper enzyme maturation permease subunit
MSAPVPHPGFLNGLGPIFRRSLQTVLSGKKAIVLFVVMAVPPLLMLATISLDPEHRGMALITILLFLYLQFLVPMTGLLFGTGIVLDEKSGGTLPFLFTRPTPRSSLVVAKFAAAVLVGAVVLGVSVALTLVLSAGAEVKPGTAGRAFAAILLAYPAYLAAFAFLGALTRWALLGGFLYAFGLEGFLGLIPGMVREATLLHYSRSLVGESGAGLKVFEFLTRGSEPVTNSEAVTVLLSVTAVYLCLTIAVVAIKQFAERNPGRA